METPAVLLLFMLVTSSVVEAKGRSSQVDVEEEEKKVAVETTEDKLSVTRQCVACKMAVMSVKNHSRPYESKKSLKSKLYATCSLMKYLRFVCKRFVKKHLQELINGLKTKDDFQTICVNVRACKSDDLMRNHF